MKKTELTKLSGRSREGHYIYEIVYEHNLYEVTGMPNHYEFITQLPFSGLDLNPNGGRVELTVLLPTGASVDQNLTKGIDQNGTETAKFFTPIQGINRTAVSFEYHIDPIYTVHYFYNE